MFMTISSELLRILSLHLTGTNYVQTRYIISSLDMFSSIAENLINYTFNVRLYRLYVLRRRI
jgi:hypothetical protein